MFKRRQSDISQGLTHLPSGKRIGRICSGLRARHVGKVAKQEKHHETTRILPIDRGSRRSNRPAGSGSGRHGAGSKARPRRSTPRSPGFGSDSPHRTICARPTGSPARPASRYGAPIRLMTRTTTGPRPSASANSHFYRVGDIVVPATEYEYRMVIANPNMYYFSSALKLHCRIQRKRDGVPEPV